MIPQDETKHRTVVILATGGTLAGVGEEGTSIGYASGSMTVETLLGSVPALESRAEIEAIQVCNINSDDIDARTWIELAREIDRQAAHEDVAGIVVTHGTDTMEETAFFLNLVIDTLKPVVITGSMRPATAVSADGPMNILEAVSVAACPSSFGRGVLVQFAGSIFSARSVRKANTHAICAMDGSEMGACGAVCDGKVSYYWNNAFPHTSHTEFDAGSIDDLPKVSVLFFHADADPALIAAAADISDGLVIAGAGAGEFSLPFKEQIEKLDIPVVVSSRIGMGQVEQDALLCPGTIAARDLSPQKAAILLRLALARHSDRCEIERIFQTY